MGAYVRNFDLHRNGRPTSFKKSVQSIWIECFSKLVVLPLSRFGQCKKFQIDHFAGMLVFDIINFSFLMSFPMHMNWTCGDAAFNEMTCILLAFLLTSWSSALLRTSNIFTIRLERYQCFQETFKTLEAIRDYQRRADKDFKTVCFQHELFLLTKRLSSKIHIQNSIDVLHSKMFPTLQKIMTGESLDTGQVRSHAMNSDSSNTFFIMFNS